jgi:hypothetical protein
MPEVPAASSGLAVRVAEGERDADRRARRGVLARVAQQVGEHLVQTVLVALHQNRLVR